MIRVQAVHAPTSCILPRDAGEDARRGLQRLRHLKRPEPALYGRDRRDLLIGLCTLKNSG
jgi:hypothetical protein